jgi:hypothetical protein
MTIPTPAPKPGDPQQNLDAVCFPGKAVTLFVERCDNSTPILLFAIADSVGKLYSYNSGVNYAIVCAYSGQILKISADGMLPKDHTFTQAEINARQATVCLDAIIVSHPPTHPSGCTVSKVVALDYPKVDDPIMGDLKALRAFFAFDPVGRDLIAAYEDEELQENVISAVSSNVDLQLATLRLALTAAAVARALLKPGASNVPLSLAGPDESDCGPVISAAVVSDVRQWGQLVLTYAGEALAPHVERLAEFVESFAGLMRQEVVSAMVGASPAGSPSDRLSS